MPVGDVMQDEIANAFSHIAARYGFNGPHYKQLGNEHYFEYFRGAQEISIMIDYSGPPLVELYIPVTPGSPAPQPWAELGGVKRYRKFPRLKVMQPWQPDSPAPHLNELAEKLEVSEMEFLVSASTHGHALKLGDPDGPRT